MREGRRRTQYQKVAIAGRSSGKQRNNRQQLEEDEKKGSRQ